VVAFQRPPEAVEVIVDCATKLTEKKREIKRTVIHLVDLAGKDKICISIGIF
jgi:hypothetical protein